MRLTRWHRLFAIALAAVVVGSAAVHAARLPVYAFTSPVSVQEKGQEQGAAYVYSHVGCTAGVQCSMCACFGSQGVGIVAAAPVLPEPTTPHLGAPAAAPVPEVRPERINPIRAPPQSAL